MEFVFHMAAIFIDLFTPFWDPLIHIKFSTYLQSRESAHTPQHESLAWTRGRFVAQHRDMSWHQAICLLPNAPPSPSAQ